MVAVVTKRMKLSTQDKMKIVFNQNCFTMKKMHK